MRWLVSCAIWMLLLQHAWAQAQSTPGYPCPPGAVCVPIPRHMTAVPAERDYGRVSFGAGVFGAIASGLVLTTTIAMAASDELGAMPALRASTFGVTLAAAPAIAFSALATRQRVGLKGQRQLLLWAVSAWIGAVINGGFQLSAALRGFETPPELTVVTGALGCVGLTAFTLDAFTTAHRARIKQNYRVVVGPASIRFRF